MADIDSSVLDQARDLCTQLLDSQEDEAVYWLTADRMGLFADYMGDSRTASELYMHAAFLTDRWELRPELRKVAAAEMRNAAADLVAATGSDELDAYVVRWNERLGIPG